MTESTPIPPIVTATIPKLRHRRLLAAIFGGLGLLLTALGIFVIVLGFCADAPLAVRIFLFIAGPALLFLPGVFAFVSLRRKLTTGRWTMTPEEVMDRRRQIAAKPPSRAFRIATSAWFDLALNLAILVLAGAMVWSAFRSGFHPFDVVMAVFWIAFAAHSIRQINRRRLKPFPA
jgi:MFS family permease